MTELTYRSSVNVKESVAATVAAYENTASMLKSWGKDESEFKYPKGGKIQFKVGTGPQAEANEEELYMWDDNYYAVDLPAIRDVASKAMGLNVAWMSKATPVVEITDAHRASAEKVIDAITSSVIMTKLRGQKVSEFVVKLTQLVEKDTITFADYGLLTYVAKTADQIKESDKVAEKKSEFVNTSRALGRDGEKSVARITIISKRYISRWDSYCYNVHDNNGSLIIFFRNAGNMDVGETYNISAKVKGNPGPDSYAFGAITTKVNFVRMRK